MYLEFAYHVACYFLLLDLFLQFCAKGALLRQWLAVAVDCGHTHTPIRDRQRQFARRLADVLFANLFGDVASKGSCLYCTSTVPIKAQDLTFSATKERWSSCFLN